MSKTTKLPYPIALLLLFTITSTSIFLLSGWSSGKSCSKCEEQKTALQDFDRAQAYFNDHVSFNTNPSGIRSLFRSKEDIVVVDVRDAESYQEGHIPGAINIPYTDHLSFQGTETSFPGLRKDVFNYVYCYSEYCNLAHRAAKKFASLGYPVKVILGGFDSW